MSEGRLETVQILRRDASARAHRPLLQLSAAFPHRGLPPRGYSGRAFRGRLPSEEHVRVFCDGLVALGQRLPGILLLTGRIKKICEQPPVR